MGIPKFFRWLSERYPKINQRHGSPPNPETVQSHFNDPTLDPSQFYAARPPDPLSQCSLPPEIDRLYIDMNGILHGCSHNNATHQSEDDTREEFDTETSSLTVAEIFRNVEYYLDRIVVDIAKPKQLVYMAIDGVAPRAKLNQQRSRRYRSGQEGEIEQTVYQAHLTAMEELSQPSPSKTSTIHMDHPDAVAGFSNMPVANHDDDPSLIKEVQPGRFAGKFVAHSLEARSAPRQGAHKSAVVDDDDWMNQPFHSHLITPGTAFMEAVSDRLQTFVQHKLDTDPKWKHLTIIFSGSEVPGEGEHKIMDFIRHQKSVADPNTRHCIMGQDGDLIILGLVAHEPNLVLLRERVEFGADAVETGVFGYIHNPNFEFLHINILRDYLAFDMETSDVVSNSLFDLENTIDDFCFMTFLIGNDFLPHLPALDIGDEALELLFEFYKKQRLRWLDGKRPPYLTHRGNIVSGQRLENFLAAVGAHETSYYDNKKRGEVRDNEQMRSQYKKLGLNEDVFPSQDILEQKEEADRAKYREMMLESITSVTTTGNAAQSIGFQPVMSASAVSSPTSTEPQDIIKSQFEPEQTERDEGFFTRLGNLLQISIKPSAQGSSESTSSTPAEQLTLDDQDLKGRYYYDKFGFSPFDAESHLALRKAYIEGLVWNLKYYYEGCVSWDWHYPFHYGPMISDLVDLNEILQDISFEGKKGKPLNPFEQLLACLPPSSAYQLPEPYRWLMTDPNSPISDFYPKTFSVDMNGKRWPWEAVALLPFVDKERLLQAAAKVKDKKLSQGERRRNRTGHVVVIAKNPSGETDESSSIARTPFESTEWKYDPTSKPVFEPRLTPGVKVPLPGFATLRSVPIKKLLKARSGINVFNSRSRYTTVFLVTTEEIPDFPPLELLAPRLIGETALINFPFFTEAVITAVSNKAVEYRGKDKPKFWSENEASYWDKRYKVLRERQAIGEGFSGSGGWLLPTSKESIKLSVRSFKGFKTLQDGTVAKLFVPFEIEVPLISAIWSPEHPDPRIADLPLLLEKDPFHMPTLQWQSSLSKDSGSRDVSVLPVEQQFPLELVSPIEQDGRSSVGALFADQFGNREVSGLRLLPTSEVVAENGVKTESKQVSVLPMFENVVNEEPPENFKFFDQLTTMLATDGKEARQAETALVPKSHERAELINLISENNGTAMVTLQPSDSVISQVSLLPGKVGPQLGKELGNSRFLQSLKSLEGTTSKSTTKSSPGKNNLSRGKARNVRTKRQVATPTTRSFSTTSFQVATRHRGGIHNKVVFLGFAVAAAATFGAKFVNGANHFGFTDKGVSGLESVAFVGRAATPYLTERQTNDCGALSPPGAPDLKFAHGTTTLSFIFKGGIIAAVDSRASMGNFVGSKTTQKVLPINSHILATMAGGAADCGYLTRWLHAQAWQYELNFGHRMSVARASRLLSNVLYTNRGLGISLGTMIMGFDMDGIPSIYCVDDSGARIEGNHFAIGSGSTFALGILDTSELFDLTEDEAIALGIKAIRHATFRDGSSGGFINVYLITSDGYKKVFSQDLALLQQQVS